MKQFTVLAMLMAFVACNDSTSAPASTVDTVNVADTLSYDSVEVNKGAVTATDTTVAEINKAK